MDVLREQFSVAQLRSMINQMVEQAVGEKLGARAASWQAERTAIYSRLSSPDSAGDFQSQSGARWGAIGAQLSGMAGILGAQENRRLDIKAKEAFERQIYQIDPSKKSVSTTNTAADTPTGMQSFSRFLGGVGNSISGAVGLDSAYKNRDPFGGAMSGYQMATGIGSMFNAGTQSMQTLGWIGMGLGLLIGLFGKKKEIDEWKKPKFQDAEKAYNKLFTVDRGEEDLYYMPESFYFRSGWSGPRHIVVKVGNDQFDSHIRESMTSSYATQLQRGLVF